jgi:NADH-quinone oxidoreductase subunit J
MFTMLLAQTETLELIVRGWLAIATLLGGVGLLGLMLALGRQRVSAGTVIVALLPILAALGINLYSQPINFELALLHLVTWLAILLGAGFVAFRQPVYAALSFAGIILTTCIAYVLNEAPFIAAATMIVYAGAIIIVFLFVLMFAQRSHLQGYDLQLNTPLIAVIAGAGLFGLLAYAVSDMPINAAAESSASSVKEFGMLLFTKYLWTVELAGTLLLIASVAAIVIAQDQAVLSDQHTTTAQPPESPSARTTAKGASV